LSIFRLTTNRIAAFKSGAILAPTGRGPRVSRRARKLSPGRPRGFYCFVLTLFLLTPPPNRAHPEVIRLPFRTSQTMILVQAKVNGVPAVFLLDTGASLTIVSARAYGNVPFRLRSVERTSQGAGMIGDSVALHVDLQLANHRWSAQRVAVMNLDGLTQILGIYFDGLLGQDVLREFRSVRIDYHAHVIELER
jgi:Aspartyl protease